MTIPGKRVLGRVAVTLPVAAALLAAGLAPTSSVEGSTTEQVTAGRTVYESSCLFCHGVNLQGSVGPALAGETTRIRNLPSAQALFDYVKATMPLNAPGSLSDDEYWAVTAYLVSENGVAPDEVPLGPATASSVPVYAEAGAAPVDQAEEPAPVAEEEQPQADEPAEDEIPTEDLVPVDFPTDEAADEAPAEDAAADEEPADVPAEDEVTAPEAAEAPAATPPASTTPHEADYWGKDGWVYDGPTK